MYITNCIIHNSCLKKGLITLTLLFGISGAFLKIDLGLTWGDPKLNKGKKQIWRFGLGVFSRPSHGCKPFWEWAVWECSFWDNHIKLCSIWYWYIWWIHLFETQTFCHIFTLRNLLFAKCADWESTILRHAHFATVPFLRHFTF